MSDYHATIEFTLIGDKADVATAQWELQEAAKRIAKRRYIRVLDFSDTFTPAPASAPRLAESKGGAE